MRIAITGSNGFIGSAVVNELLQHAHDVCVLVRDSHQSSVAGITALHYHSSIADCETELKKWQPDVFFHLAWRGVNKEERSSEENNTYNIQLTLDTVKVAYETGCKQWIGCGSQAEYGVKNFCINEVESCNPVTDYGKTKFILCAAAEELCRHYGLNYTWARIFSVYGPGDHATTFVSYLFQTMLQNKVPQVSSCTQLWDYLFIDDAAKGIVSLIDHNGIFNIAGGHAIELKLVAEQIASLTNYNGTIAWGSKPDGSVKHLCGNIDKIKAISMWRPKVSLTEGLNKTLNYHLQL